MESSKHGELCEQGVLRRDGDHHLRDQEPHRCGHGPRSRPPRQYCTIIYYTILLLLQLQLLHYAITFTVLYTITVRMGMCVYVGARARPHQNRKHEHSHK